MIKINDVVVKIGSVDDFFAEAKKMMQALDNKELTQSLNTITFEDDLYNNFQTFFPNQI